MNKSATTQAEIDKVQCWIDKRRGEQTDLRASCQTTLNMSLVAKITRNAVLIAQAETMLAIWRLKSRNPHTE